MEDKLDELYENRDEIRKRIKEKGLTAGKSKSIGAKGNEAAQSIMKPTKKSSSVVSDMLQKKKFHEELMQVCHGLLDKKRHKQRLNYYFEVKEHCKPQNKYEQKVQYLDQNIEAA